MKVKRKTFQSDLVNYIEYDVYIGDETVTITQKNNLSNEFESIEISRTVFEEIVEFFKEVDSDGDKRNYVIKRRNYEIKQITSRLFYGICRRCGLIVTGQYRDVKKRMMLHSCDDDESANL